MNIIKFSRKNMFNKESHHTYLIKILKKIYNDPSLRNILGFKGGTAAVLFYNLPRVSVDLDFDLLDENKKNLVLEKIKKIIDPVGEIIESIEKRYTLFFLLSYKKDERKIKIEISKRPVKTVYEVKNYLGIPILVMNKEEMIAGKMSTFLTRKKFASRDLFDLWYFLRENWKIDENFLKEKTNFDKEKAIKMSIRKTKDIKSEQLLQGLGDFLDEKQKYWVKNKLKEETIFLLNLYLKTIAKLYHVNGKIY